MNLDLVNDLAIARVRLDDAYCQIVLLLILHGARDGDGFIIHGDAQPVFGKFRLLPKAVVDLLPESDDIKPLVQAAAKDKSQIR